MRGHNAIRDELHRMASPVHAGAELEPLALIPSQPALRQADVLTSACHNGRFMAIDVGVICPAAAGAGADCVVTMDQRKRARMIPYAAELNQSAIEYQPFALSCWGRLHPSADKMIKSLARYKARREGLSSENSIYRQLVARITSCVWRRAARMALRCRPCASGDEAPGELSIDAACVVRAGDPASADLPPLP